MHKTTCALLLLLCPPLLAGAAQAAPLTAYTVPVAPWTFPDHPERGVAPEYLRYLFDEAAVPLKLDTEPYMRAVHGLSDGSNVAALLIPDAERDAFALRLCEVTTIRSGVLYRRSRFAKLNEANLPGLTVGVPHGTHALDKLPPSVKRYDVESVAQGLKMLQADHLDATFLSSPGSKGLLRDNALDEAQFGWLEIDRQPVVVYLSKRSPLAGDAAALARLRNVCEGKGRAVMDGLMQKYR